METGVELWASSARQEWGLRAWSEACCWKREHYSRGETSMLGGQNQQEDSGV